ncbi:MAG: hypothetical protein H6711_03865 [Myxococcales bacterium]|nr:hypothetical protein [Myxococcales bacterium]
MALASALSDGVLALTSFACARALVAAEVAPPARRSLRGAALGLGLIGAAALCGTLRFAGLEGLAWLHGALSGLATAAAMPTIGAAALALTWPFELSPRGWGRLVVILVALAIGAGLAGVAGLWGLAIGAIGTCGVIVGGVRGLAIDRRGGALLIGGAALVLIAGLAVGSEGELGPFARLDVFHYLLALANLGLARGLLGVARR